MSEYWVAHKKYFCKYCEIYIADDAPSRRQHESGLRHKGNRDRYVRGLYKQGEKAKKDLEEEKREMARIEAAANAAYAGDVSSGRASAASSSSSRPTKQGTAPDTKKTERPSSVFSNYSTAQSLGYTDPDEERLKAEEERRRTQGVVGEWEVVAPPPPPLPGENGKGEDAKEGVLDGNGTLKRSSDAHAEDMDDGRSFKLRKRTLGAGLDDIWDPGDIPIKLKSKQAEEASPALDGTKSDDSAVANDLTKTTEPTQTSEQSSPKWKPMRWKPASESTADIETRRDDPVKDEEGGPGAEGTAVKQDKSESTPSSGQETQASNQVQQIADISHSVSVKSELKEEENQTPLGDPPVSSLFKKRKLPSGVRGRR